MAYVTTINSLPRSLDVQISVSRPAAELRTDLSTLCVACEDLGFLPDATRIRFYSTLAAVEADFASTTEAYRAASAFFAQTPRPPQMAIGEVFFNPQSAVLASSPLTATEIAAIAAVADGSMDVVYDPGTGAATQAMTAMDFTGVTTIEAIAAVIDAKTGAALTCSVKTLPGGSKILVITTVATGDGKTISLPVANVAGTFVGVLLNLTAAAGGKVLNGYTPGTISDELTNVSNAANAVGKNIYGWCLGATLRDVAIQTVAAEWALGHTVIMPLVTNDVTALDPTYEDDIGSVVQATGNRRVAVIYHDVITRYPDVSILAYMLSVNYQIQDSTVTAKFKQLPGIETVVLTETQWAALQAKGYNTYTAIGNSARTYRDGVTEDTVWYMDTVINIDNFVEDLSVNVYNVFLRNRKVPYTRKGQMLLVDAMRDTGNQYIFNGTFAPREITDTELKSGYKILPAVSIVATPVAQMSVAQRAARVAPPVEITVQEAGAMHSIAINVEVVS